MPILRGRPFFHFSSGPSKWTRHGEASAALAANTESIQIRSRIPLANSTDARAKPPGLFWEAARREGKTPIHLSIVNLYLLLSCKCPQIIDSTRTGSGHFHARECRGPRHGSNCFPFQKTGMPPYPLDENTRRSQPFVPYRGCYCDPANLLDRPRPSGPNARYPPSTARSVPVMNAASSLKRNRIAAAHSTGSPQRSSM